jgi:hypothetical protein
MVVFSVLYYNSMFPIISTINKTATILNSPKECRCDLGPVLKLIGLLRAIPTHTIFRKRLIDYAETGTYFDQRTGVRA